MEFTRPGYDSQSYFLAPGDILGLHGPARWDWYHGIPAQTHDLPIHFPTHPLQLNTLEAEPLKRGRRISLTFRRLTKLDDSGTASS